jgi:DNA-binding beta-propeller fold protein YncE
VSEPSLLVFARLANGSAAPVRMLAGQATRLSRTMHGIAYDAAHDEIIVPVYLAGAVLSFPGGAQGEEPPLRVIQGPKTRLLRPETVNLDATHDEIVVGDTAEHAVLTFPRDAHGDVSPLRIIEGPKTKLHQIHGVAVDPVHNLIVVSNINPRGITGLLIFNRTDTGDVAPRGIITGPHTGIVRVREVQVDPAQGLIFVAVKNNHDSYNMNSPQPSPWDPTHVGFIGVWRITDNGDVPPDGIIKGPASGLVWPAGVAINPRDAEVYVIDSVRNGLVTFSVPEFFRQGFHSAQDTK